MTAQNGELEAGKARYRGYNSLVAMFFEQAAKFGDRPCLWHKAEGRWHALTYADVAMRVRALAARLRELGLQPGERVVLVAENSPNWVLSDLAVMAAGGVTVPAYTTNTPKDNLHILSHSAASGLILSSQVIARRVLPALSEALGLKFLIHMQDLPHPEAAPIPANIQHESWESALAAGTASPDPDLEARIDHLKRTDMACIIYTSGTGGVPKGVMLSHGAILCNCMGAFDLLYKFGLEDEIFLSFLPLSHSYEHTAGLYFPLSIGAQIYYAESVEALIGNISEVRPTIMTSVPRLYETIHRRILHAVSRDKKLKRDLFHKALDIGRRRYEQPSSLSTADRLLDPLLERLVRRKVARRFGGRLKGFVSGGAPLTYEVGLFFHALGVRLLQGYGQTETAPIVSCNPPCQVRIDSVGTLFPEVEVKIAEDGEILVRGELCMLGYWRDQEATAATIQEGWLHTGDIGRLDAEGYLYITDRKKDIIVLSGGDNVAPQRIEGFLVLQPEIAQAMVLGDKKPHLVALLVPEQEWLRSWAQEQGKSADLAALRDDPVLHQALSAVVDRVNKDLSILERIKRFAIATEPFSIDNAELTPTMKIRRHTIRERYGAELEKLFG